jgi:hypothetical protein
VRRIVAEEASCSSLVNIGRAGPRRLPRETARRTCFPDQSAPVGRTIDAHLDAALGRLERCIDGVRPWQPGEFDYLHSSQYTIFLYYLANTIWRAGVDTRLCTKLFLLNKALNGSTASTRSKLPEVFFIGHSVGIVLAKATYGEHLVLYQNSTSARTTASRRCSRTASCCTRTARSSAAAGFAAAR